MAYVYILKCTNGSYYTGSAVDVIKRIKTHLSRSSAAAKYTRSHTVEEVAAIWEAHTLSEAGKLEYYIKKKLIHAQKEMLVSEPSRLCEYLSDRLKEFEYKYYGRITASELEELRESVLRGKNGKSG